jgi:hypothetical protein
MNITTKPNYTTDALFFDEAFRHIRTVQLVTEFAIVVPGADAADDGELQRSVLLARDPCRLLHE